MTMKPYMGYPFGDSQKDSSNRELPKVSIEGTVFLANLKHSMLQEIDNPHNRIILAGVKDEMGFTRIFYDLRAKNHYCGDTSDPTNIPDHVALVFLPCWKEIDPIGLSRRQGLPDHYHKKAEDIPAILKIQTVCQQPKEHHRAGLKQKL